MLCNGISCSTYYAVKKALPYLTISYHILPYLTISFNIKKIQILNYNKMKIKTVGVFQIFVSYVHIIGGKVMKVTKETP